MKGLPITGTRYTTIFAVLLAIGLAASYSNCFNVGFYFDDAYGISNNPAIRSLRNVPSFFTDPYAVWTEGTQVDLRPVLMATFAANYAISGLAPWSYHVLNMLLHFATAFLVFVLVRDHVWWPPGDRGPAGDARFPAAAAALFLALAPINTQPVLYIWARSALLCVTFYLGAFLAYLCRRWWLGSLLLALALLTKAIAVTLPAALLLHAILYRDRTEHATIVSRLRDWRRLLLPVALPSLLVAAYLLYRQLVLPDWARAHAQESSITPGIWFMSQWSALLYYVRLFLWPDALSVDHAFPYAMSPFEPRAWVPLLVILTWLAVSMLFKDRYPQATFATLWFFLTLAPESSIAPLAEVINDHRPYIAESLGLSVLLVWLLDRGAAVLPPTRRRPVFLCACLVLCLAAIPMNRHRTWQWGDPARIWEDTVRKSPNNGRAWMNLGLVYSSRGDLVTARRHFERARDISPNYVYVHMNLSGLELTEGHLDQALAEALQAVRLRPDMALTHYYLGRTLQRQGRTTLAAAAYHRAIELDPRDRGYADALASVDPPAPESEEGLMAAGLYALHTLNEPEMAIAQFHKVLELIPAHYGATYQLAAALDLAGRAGEARPLWTKVLAMAERYNDPGTIEAARKRLAKSDSDPVETAMKAGLDTLYRKRDPTTAATRFREVLAVNPDHYGATYQLAAVLDVLGKPAEARPLWEKVLRMAEGYHDAETAEVARARLTKRP